jgi:hypothetical protein
VEKLKDLLDDISDKINYVIRKTIFFLQRVFRGWSEDEMWNLDVTLARYIYPKLEYFKGCHGSHPADVTWEEWLKILDKMIRAFRYVADEEEFKIEDPDIEVYRQKLKAAEDDCREGLELFARYYRNLWD